MRLVFWQNTPSPHQSALIRALAAAGDVRVELVVEHDLPAWRRELGWSVPDFGAARVVVAPPPEEADRLAALSPEESVHVFSGIDAYPLVARALGRAAATPARVGVLSEAGDWRGWKGAARIARARLAARRYRDRLDFVLGIGSLGVRWFRMAGYPERILHPFGYFVETPPPAAVPDLGGDAGEVRILFVGQCIHRKGIDLLLRALAGLARPGWRLTVVGDGEDRGRLEALAARLGLAGRVRFAGAMPNERAVEELAAADLLVLPSRWDGWGAVVNEALMRGVPVLCSDLCGAADLVAADRGAVFRAGSVGGLGAALAGLVARGPRTEARSRPIREWSGRISGEAAAAYLRQVVAAAGGSAPRPEAPWLS